MRGKTTFFIIFLFGILVIGFTSSVDAQVVDPIIVSVDKLSYTDGEKIIVSGQVGERLDNYYDVTLKVISPNGDVIQFDQMGVNDYKKFQTILSVGGPTWNEAGSGTYSIKVLYATVNRTAETSFQYIGSDATQPRFEDNKDSKGLAPFVDPNQEPQYYVDRYNNEPKYKEWFDSNFPEYDSIYQAVGLKEPTAESYEIPIVGDDSCKIKTSQALELLKNKAKNHFKIVTDHISIIECVDKGSGIRVQDSSVKIGKITMGGGTVWYAGVLVHESCHSLLYSDYLKNNPQSNYVPSDVYSGRNAEAFCLGLQYYALSLIDHGRYSSDYMVNLLKSEYWEIPYADRWW